MMGGDGSAEGGTSVNVSEDRPYDLSDFQGLFIADPKADRKNATHPAGTPAPSVDFQRLKDLALLLADPRPGQKILEIGCGRGANAVPCGLQGAEVWGQDLDETWIARATQHFQHFGIRGDVKQGDATRLQFDDNAFDTVLSSDFHEHLTTPQQLAVLTEAYRVLRPGGKLVLKTPNLSYLKASLWLKRLRAVLRLQDPRGFVIPHTPGTFDPQHVGLTTRWRVTRHLATAGFLNYRFTYAPLRRFGLSPFIEVMSTEVPFVRDILCEDLFLVAYKAISMGHFPLPQRSSESSP